MADSFKFGIVYLDKVENFKLTINQWSLYDDHYVLSVVSGISADTFLSSHSQGSPLYKTSVEVSSPNLTHTVFIYSRKNTNIFWDCQQKSCQK